MKRFKTTAKESFEAEIAQKKREYTDLTSNDNFYYIAVTEGEEKEIHVTETEEEASELLN